MLNPARHVEKALEFASAAREKPNAYGPETAPRLASVYATLALAAEQRTANLIAEAKRIAEALEHADELLRDGEAARMREALHRLNDTIARRLDLSVPAPDIATIMRGVFR